MHKYVLHRLVYGLDKPRTLTYPYSPLVSNFFLHVGVLHHTRTLFSCPLAQLILDYYALHPVL
jgi:hypothetical protein